MDSPYAAGGEDPDPCQIRYDHGGGNGSRAVETSGDKCRKVSAAGFGDRSSGFAEILYFITRKAGLQTPADNCDRRGDRSVVADRLFNGQCSFNIPGIGHSVGYYRAFKRDNRSPALKRFFDFRRYVEILIHLLFS